MEKETFITTHTNVGDNSSFRQGNDYIINIYPRGSSATNIPITQLGKESSSEAAASQIQANLLRSIHRYDYEAFKRRTPKWSDGTCKWILEHKQYKEWLHSPTSSILWVSGHPGCGKSILASFLVEALRSPESQANLTGTVCHFFFKDDNIDQKSSTNAASALLHQYLTKEGAEKILQNAVRKIQQKKSTISPDLDSLVDVWTLLTEGSADSDGPNLICVIDAIDECEDHRDLMKLLINFFGKEATVAGTVDTSTALKVVVTGRPYTILERGFDKMCAEKINLGDVTSAIEHDIRLVVKSEIDKFGTTFRLSSKSRTKIAAHLTDMADRTFLWVKLALDKLRALEEDGDYYGSQSEIDQILDTASLDEMYDKILARTSRRYPELVRDVLGLILAAIRPLSVTELNIALSVKRGDSFEDWGQGAFPYPELAIQNICGLLVRVIDDNVSLMHSTAREFLLASIPASTDGIWKHSFQILTCNRQLAKICMIYLLHQKLETNLIGSYSGDAKKDTIEAVMPFTTRYGFLDYAAKNWAHHYHTNQTDIQSELFEFALDLCDSNANGLPLWFQTFWTKDIFPGRCPHHMSPLMIASSLNLEEPVKSLLMRGADANEKTDTGMTALDLLALSNESLNPSSIDNFPTAKQLYSFGGRFASLIQQGTVKWINQMKGFGFISPILDRKSLFVSLGLIGREAFDALQQGDSVSYRKKLLMKGDCVIYVQKESTS